MLWKINNRPTPVRTPKITFTTHGLNTIYGRGRRLFHNANLFICIKKKMRDGWFGGRWAHWGTYLEEDNKFPHTKMVSGGGAHFDRSESLSVPKQFCWTVQTQKSSSFVLLGCCCCSCSAVNPDERICHGRLAGLVRRRNCQAKLGRLFQISTTPPPPPPLPRHPHTKARKEWGIFQSQ